MTKEEWASLKVGDKIVFIGDTPKWPINTILTIDEVHSNETHLATGNNWQSTIMSRNKYSLISNISNNEIPSRLNLIINSDNPVKDIEVKSMPVSENKLVEKNIAEYQYSVMTTENKIAVKFRAKHVSLHLSSKKGFKYTFENTGIGELKYIVCMKCKKKKNITDYDLW